MKKIILALLVVMLAAGSAYAVDVKVVKGSYRIQGSFWGNTGLAATDTADFMAYDQDFDLSVDFVVDETTKVITVIEIADEEPMRGDNNQDAWTGDDNILFRQVYLDHKFATGTVLDAGRMPGGTWAFAYMDNGGPRDRVKVTQFFPWGLIVGLVEKDAENGYTDVEKDGEKDDQDTYAIGAVINAGPVAIMPLWFHVISGAVADDQDDDDLIVDYFALALSGNFGMIGFEAEYGFVQWEYDTGLGTDADVNGIYANVWANFEAFKIGGLFMWNSVDDDAGLGMESGGDLDETYLIGEELDLTAAPWSYAGASGAAGHAGLNCYQVYADFAFGDFSFGGSLSFYSSNWDGDDTTMMEYNLKAGYKITDNLSYNVGLGVASIDADEDKMANDPDDAVYAFHSLKVSF